MQYIVSQCDVTQEFTSHTHSYTAEYSGSRFSVAIIVFQRSANAIVENQASFRLSVKMYFIADYKKGFCFISYIFWTHLAVSQWKIYLIFKTFVRVNNDKALSLSTHANFSLRLIQNKEYIPSYFLSRKFSSMMNSWYVNHS